VKRPTLLAPEPTRPAAPPASMPHEASIGRRVLREDRARIRRAVRERRRAESAEVRRFTRGARRRRIVGLAAAGFLVVSVATPVLLAVSPAFAVRTVTVSGGDAALAAQVRAALAPEVGVPIALVDGTDVAARIGRIAAVERFSVARIPPGTLDVRVVPRTPVGQVRAGGGYALVDAAGVRLATAATRIPAVPLVAPAPGTPAFAAAAAVLRSLPATIAPRVRAVAAPTPDDVRLTLTDGRLVVWGGPEDGSAKAAALRAALVAVARGAHRIDVSVPGAVSVG
jgi:cell division protein FtsQ